MVIPGDGIDVIAEETINVHVNKKGLVGAPDYRLNTQALRDKIERSIFSF